MKYSELRGGKKSDLYNTEYVQPSLLFYELYAEKINNDIVKFDDLRKNKIVIVNTASNCGFTPQLEELQQLNNKFDNLVILAFPSNDFKNQEKLTDDEIENFCAVNYKTSFHLMKKSVVVKDQYQHPVFHWLTHPELNGWCNKFPSWNFCKYIIDGNGVLTHFVGPAVSPLSTKFLNALNELH
jgi:glutathione peroxidase